MSRTFSLSARNVTLALIPASLVGLLAIWAILNETWNWLLAQPGNPPAPSSLTFGDLRQVTSTATCISADPNWSMATETCDPYGRGYNYPSFWARGFAALQLEEKSTDLIGLAFIAIFVFAIFIVSLLSIRQVRPTIPIVGVAVAATAPPTWLALERGNIDVFVFAIVTCAALATVVGKGATSAVLLAIASLAKIFPTGAALILVRDRKEHPTNLWIFAALMAVGLAFVVVEMPLISQRTPQPTGSAFGASLLFQTVWNRFDLQYPSLAPRVIGVLVFLIVFFAYIVMLRIRMPKVSQSILEAMNSISRDRISSTLVLSGGGPLVFSYLLGTNFDYRLVFAIPLVAGLGRSATQGLGPAFLLMSTVVLQLWLSYPMSIWVQRFSDLIWIGLAPAIGLLMLHLVHCRTSTKGTN